MNEDATNLKSDKNQLLHLPTTLQDIKEGEKEYQRKKTKRRYKIQQYIVSQTPKNEDIIPTQDQCTIKKLILQVPEDPIYIY